MEFLAYGFFKYLIFTKRWTSKVGPPDEFPLFYVARNVKPDAAERNFVKSCTGYSQVSPVPFPPPAQMRPPIEVAQIIRLLDESGSPR